jgi:hypothetical protein
MHAALGLAVFIHLGLFLLLGLLDGQAPSRPDTLPSTVYIETEPAGRMPLLIQERPAGEANEPPKATALSDQNRSVPRETRARPTIARPGALANLGALRDLGRLAGKFSPRSELQRESGDPSSPSSSVDDEQIPMGAETLLNTRQSVYYSFYSRLYHSIAPIWQSRIGDSRQLRPAPGSYTTRVAVLFDREGNLKALQILDSSQIAFLDRVVIESWKRVPRFPNPPQGLIEADGTVRTLWSFTVDVGEGRGLQFLPPRRI